MLRGDAVIVSPKKPPKQVKFRWDPDLVRELERLAERTGRTMTDTAELLMKWAVERAKAELELAAKEVGELEMFAKEPERRRKK